MGAVSAAVGDCLYIIFTYQNIFTMLSTFSPVYKYLHKNTFFLHTLDLKWNNEWSESGALNRWSLYMDDTAVNLNLKTRINSH